MSPGAQVDYEALAKQAGAISSQPAAQSGVDYEALAKQAGAIDSQPPASTQAAQPTPNPYVQGAEDVAKGAGKGLLNTVSGVSGALNKLPWIGKYLAPSEGIQAMHQMATPTDTAQKVGYYGEQGAEFLTPLGEEDAGLAAARYLPWLGKAAPVAGRLAVNALATGGINKLQGGDFTTGAAMGAGSGLLGEGIRAVAPKIAESALGITQRMRSPTKTIGQAVLDETSGITPGAIASSAGQKISALTDQLNNLAGASQNMASLKPALDVLTQAQTVARARNSGPMLNKINAVMDQLTTDIQSGATIPQGPNAAVSASKILDLKRGVGDLVNSWAPQDQKGIQPIIKRVYGALNSELADAVPGAADLNQKISSLIPAATRARVLSGSAPLLQKVAGRAAAHTGALAGAGIGSALGYQKGGAEGAVLGGAAGLIAPELLASPTAQMATARVAQKAPAALPFLKGLALQAARTGQPAPQPPQEQDQPPPPPQPPNLPWISFLRRNQ
jgi:hypothetical protein